jgi:hypothetical protein
MGRNGNPSKRRLVPGPGGAGTGIARETFRPRID